MITLNPANSANTSSGFFKRSSWVIFVILVGTLLLLPMGGHASFWEKALGFGTDLLAKAAMNYSNKYEQKLGQLLQAMRTPVNPGSPGLNPGIAPQYPYDQNSGYPNPEYEQDAGYGLPPNAGYPQGGEYSGQNPQGGYPNNPNYEGYPQEQPYNTNPNQGYPSYPQGNQAGNPYGQSSAPPFPNVPPNQNYPYGYPSGQGSQAPYDPNMGAPAYPQQGYAQQGAFDPSNPNSGYPDQPPQQGAYDPYQANPAYPGQPGFPAPGGIPSTPRGIQLDVAMVKKTILNGAETQLPIQDGDILRDGRGNPQTGDKFRIMFRANTDCYVYVIAIDVSAWAHGVFNTLTSHF